MPSAHNEGKSVVAERFIRTWKNKIYNHMTFASKNAYLDNLDDIVNECNNNIIEQLKWSLLKLKIIHILTLVNKLVIKILNLKFVIVLQC